jgi:hypothetical protein
MVVALRTCANAASQTPRGARPFRVNRDGLAMSALLPLYPREPTFIARGGMSETFQNRKWQPLFNHLVHARGKGRRDFETERFRRLEINAKQEFSGLLNRKLGRVGYLYGPLT